MGLRYGEKDADRNVTLDGMSELIYTEIDDLLSPPLQDAVDQAEGDAKAAAENALEEARIGWQKLAYAVASGVVEHIVSSLEVRNIQTRGDVDVEITGTTADDGSHHHGVGTLDGRQENVTFDQVEGSGNFL